MRYVGRLIRLAFLAPPIVEMIAQGRQPAELTAEMLTRRIILPLEWEAQKRLSDHVIARLIPKCKNRRPASRYVKKGLKLKRLRVPNLLISSEFWSSIVDNSVVFHRQARHHRHRARVRMSRAQQPRLKLCPPVRRVDIHAAQPPRRVRLEQPGGRIGSCFELLWVRDLKTQDRYQDIGR